MELAPHLLHRRAPIPGRPGRVAAVPSARARGHPERSRTNRVGSDRTRPGIGGPERGHPTSVSHISFLLRASVRRLHRGAQRRWPRPRRLGRPPRRESPRLGPIPAGRAGGKTGIRPSRARSRLSAPGRTPGRGRPGGDRAKRPGRAGGGSDRVDRPSGGGSGYSPCLGFPSPIDPTARSVAGFRVATPLRWPRPLYVGPAGALGRSS
jgi:hypothetical protein